MTTNTKPDKNSKNCCIKKGQVERRIANHHNHHHHHHAPCHTLSITPIRPSHLHSINSSSIRISSSINNSNNQCKRHLRLPFFLPSINPEKQRKAARKILQPVQLVSGSCQTTTAARLERSTNKSITAMVLATTIATMAAILLLPRPLLTTTIKK